MSRDLCAAGDRVTKPEGHVQVGHSLSLIH